jgi:dihydroneopterin aldolase
MSVGKITVSNIRVYGYHGCLNEEKIVGSDYLVTIEIFADLQKAAVSDSLSDTVDYVLVNRIVKEEMAISSKLLERVAQRILDRIFLEIIRVTKVMVSVSKVNPPIGGDVEMVTVTLRKKRR